MLDEKKFLEMIYDVVDIARVNGNKISTKDVDDYFDDMELSPEQLELVYDYLTKGNITVQGYIPSFNGNSSNDSLQNNAAKNENSNTGDIIDNKSGNVLKGEKKVTETSPYTKEYKKKVGPWPFIIAILLIVFIFIILYLIISTINKAPERTTELMSKERGNVIYEFA